MDSLVKQKTQIHSCHSTKIFTSSWAKIWPAEIVAEIVLLGKKELEN